MLRLPLPIRLAIIVLIIIVDGLLIREFVRANHRLPLLGPDTMRQIVTTGSLPSPSPTPLELAVLLSETDWQGNTVIGKLTNYNDAAVYNTSLAIEVSKSKDPWEVSKTHRFTIPTAIQAGQSLYFSKRILADNGEFWWAASVASTSAYTDQQIDTLPKDLTVSTKKFPGTKQTQSTPRITTPQEPWGVAKQLDEVTWTIRVGEDERMATPQETLLALNEYRQRHSAGPLTWDDRLAAFARERAVNLNKMKATDKHEGFKAYVENEDNVRALGFWALGENAGYGYKLIGVHQIEWIYAADEGHNRNQLDPSWSHVGIGIEGLAVVFIFGGSKM